jgi:hypothetical protein
MIANGNSSRPEILDDGCDHAFREVTYATNQRALLVRALLVVEDIFDPVEVTVDRRRVACFAARVVCGSPWNLPLSSSSLLASAVGPRNEIRDATRRSRKN